MPAKREKKNKIPVKEIKQNNFKIALPLIGILILTFIIYFKSLRNGFTNYDDDILILNNPLVKDLSMLNLKHIFSSFINGMYHPLVTLTWAIEYHFWQANPLVFHAVNLFFHLLNIWLV